VIETERLLIRSPTGSKRVLTKVGMRHVADEHHYGEDVELWEARSTTSAE